MTKQTTTTKTFEQLNENGTPIYRWTMEPIRRQGKKIWVMNHLFLNPDYDQKAIFEHAITALRSFIVQQELPIWPLDPLVIDYFELNADEELKAYWYHQPAKQ